MILKKIQIRPSLFALLLCAGVWTGAGCAPREQPLTELPADELFARGDSAFAERRWVLASRILEFYLSEYIGHTHSADARMMLGDLNFARGDFAMAATHYDTFARTFANHPRALEARYKICDSYYELSPRPPLDQEYTNSALLHCEDVAENNPGTDYGTQADEKAGELRRRLATKLLDTGKFYFKRGALDAAVVYYEKVLDEYPGTEVAPAALIELIATYERLGYVEEAAATRERLRREYPRSPEAATLAADP